MAETWDTLVSNSDIAKDTPGRAQAPTKYLLFPATKFAKDLYTLIKQSNIILKQSVAM